MKRFVLVLGILLIVAGVLGIVHPTFTYHKKEEVAKLGPLQATVNEEKNAQVPLALSILLLVTGIGLTVFGAKSKA
jgi:uncharacterized membrane protein HdeD (DUF308 family)